MWKYVLRLYNLRKYQHMWLCDPATGKKIFAYPAVPGTEAAFVKVRVGVQWIVSHCHVSVGPSPAISNQSEFRGTCSNENGSERVPLLCRSIPLPDAVHFCQRHTA